MTLGRGPSRDAETSPVVPAPDVIAPSEHDDLTALLRWLGDQAMGSRVELVCAHERRPLRAPSDVFVVRLDGCAGELSAASYLELAAAGAAVVVPTTKCPQAERTATSVAAANRLLGAWPGTPRISAEIDEQQRSRRARVYELKRLPLSRRRLLFLGGLDHCWVPDVHLDQRSRVVAALQCLNRRGWAPSATEEPLWPCASLEATGCTACGVCVRVCPTGALTLQQGDSGSGLFALEHKASRCDDCGRCVALCPTSALIRTGQGNWASLLDETSRTLATGAVRRCARCGASFAEPDPGRYCPPCAFRLANPFGSRLLAAATT